MRQTTHSFLNQRRAMICRILENVHTLQATHVHKHNYIQALVFCAGSCDRRFSSAVTIYTEIQPEMGSPTANQADVIEGTAWNKFWKMITLVSSYLNFFTTGIFEVTSTMPILLQCVEVHVPMLNNYLKNKTRSASPQNTRPVVD